ncbi:MAG: CHASE2 domain-containing protein, partial [Gammaproteobacteria bacterium]|nr:CHASE2 domain-containing protein [Gammaproteobacteria bacterium]
FFEERLSAADGQVLADAIGRAEKVILFQQVRREQTQGFSIESLVDPAPSLSGSAIGLGPFPLPKIPNRVSQFWAFYPGVGDSPTLPVVALQVYALQAIGYRNFGTQLNDAGFPDTEQLPKEITNADDLSALMSTLRSHFRNEPKFLERYLKSLDIASNIDLTEDTKELLRALAHTYSGTHSYFLNFYGPPATINTIAYSAFWKEFRDSQHEIDVDGKVVFVGGMDLTPSDQVDGFFTVFSTDDGVDLSGVEIAATAFANLLDDREIRTASRLSIVGIVFLFGVVVGTLGFRLHSPLAEVSILAVGGFYFATALFFFGRHYLWIPVFTPVVLQLPLALILGLLGRYVGAKRVGENVTRAISYYVPDKVVQKLSRGVQPSTVPEVADGTCLVTDVTEYTSLSEKLSPNELAALSNEYFGLLVDRITHWNVFMWDFAGDGIIAVWTAPRDEEARRSACLASLDILRAVDDFNTRHPNSPFHTRIGLHAGSVALGNVGSGEHFAYSVRGDTPNTASRIEGLNKNLHTRLLAGEAVVRGIDDLLVRRMGSFILKGKEDVLKIYEIRAKQDDATSIERSLCEQFANGLDAFDKRQWTEAADTFKTILRMNPDDGPTRFYLDLCEKYHTSPPGPSNGTIIRLETK